MKKVAVFYPCFLGGGAEAVALWMLEALQGKYDLTLITIGNVDFDKLNSMYGTSLSDKYIKVKTLVSNKFKNITYFAIANNHSCMMLFFHLLIKMLKKHKNEYDLCISGYNATDFGKIGIQYIHWIKVLESTAFFRKISDFSQENVRKNISLANSNYVAQLAKKTYGVDAKVVFPPVVMENVSIPWNEKTNEFICSGRIVIAKEPHRIIRILKGVREQGFDIKLHMTGGGGGVYEWKYKRLVKKLVKENSAWITLYENLPYQEYKKLLAKCKYGIHFKPEPFGISVAEMVKAGAITFVTKAKQGGQMEIVGQQNEELFFANEEEAIKKIVAVLSDVNKQDRLISALQQQKDLFSTSRFTSEISDVVNDYFVSQNSNSLDSDAESIKDKVSTMKV